MRLRDHLAELFRDQGTKKALVLLGRSAFGPICETCGGSQISHMLPHQLAVCDRLSRLEHGKPFAELAMVCQCPEERDRRSRSPRTVQA